MANFCLGVMPPSRRMRYTAELAQAGCQGATEGRPDRRWLG